MAEMRVPPHLYARGGIWYVKKVIRGERQRESTGIKVGGEKELKLAIRRQREIEHVWDTEARGWTKVEVPTFGAWWDIYEATYSPQKSNPDGDGYVVKNIPPAWHRMKITQITKSMVERHLNTRLETVKQGTVTRERGLLQAVFQRAIEDGLLAKNPFADVARVKDVVRDRVLTVEEQPLLMAALSPQFQRWTLMMLGTGLRLEEARAVKVEHLDRVAGLLQVQAEAAKYNKARSVPLYAAVVEAIDDQMAAMGRLWHANQENYRQALRNGAKMAKIPHIFPHALRHTFATRYLQAGGNIFILSKILGHASVTLTEKQYVHLVKTDLVERSKGLDLGLVTHPPAATVLAFKKEA